MSNHNHHDHMDHNDHSLHSMDTTTETNSMFNTLPATTAATLLQAVMTTVMAQSGHDHHSHHRHESSMESSHAGHSMPVDSIPNGSTHLMDIHSSHVSDGGHNMPMYFHFGVDAIILFKEWSTTTTEGLIGSVIGIFILAMLYEGLKFFREFLFKKYFTSLEYSSVSVLGDDGKPVTEVHKVARNRMFSWPHILQTVLHVIQMVLSYFLMLIFMTYNVWLCLAVVAGAGMGYFLFGWRKATVVDITEHCH